MRRAQALLAVLLGAGMAGAGGQQLEPPEPRSGLLFGPKLLYYPLECQDVRGCSLECFQNGTSVVARFNLSPQDDVRLVVNAGISDEVVPRWIEVKTVSGDDQQTVLLTADTMCNFKNMLLVPRNRP